MTETSTAPSREQNNLAHLLDTQLEFVVELGRTTIELGAAQRLKAGDLVTVDSKVGEPYELRLNDALFAYGEIVVMQDRLTARVTSMTPLGHRSALR